MWEVVMDQKLNAEIIIILHFNFLICLYYAPIKKKCLYYASTKFIFTSVEKLLA